ncbi:MAG: BlaI/MecI/CopY family transcriptional regulator [Planctomycetota bacterium]
MRPAPQPTERELHILKVLWDRGEATVQEVYRALRDELPIVQNTVQAFLRTMDEKGLVRHRVVGRTFVYRPAFERDHTARGMLARTLQRVFDGALDQLVANVLSLRQPTPEELDRLRSLIEQLEQQTKRARRGGTSR